jgi:hypothetical protein
MSVRDRLASALGRRDERPNVELAEALAAKPQKGAIAELVTLLSSGSAAEQNDAIKVLYEIGERRPNLVAPHVEAFLELLGSKDNRNAWGAMSGLAAVASARPKELSLHLHAIVAAADKGSVIAKDKAISILSQLAQAGIAKAVPALLDRLETAAPNQFPMYAELALPAIGPAQRARFRAILEARLKAIEQPAKRGRVEKVLRKLSKL